ncbi:MAG: TolB protein [Mariprofundales bacterium]|nr:TolB protein [Mariprofundales bacterium]
MSRYYLQGALLSALLVTAVPAQAGDLLDWVTAGSHKQQRERLSDGATLLTLEPKQSEIYPQAAGDRDFLVTVVMRDRVALVRRALENGDPLNLVTEGMVPDSVRWRSGSVLFLSTQVGGLGLWSKPVTGMGLVKRLRQFSGRVVQPELLPNGDLIAVRLSLRGLSEQREGDRRHRSDPFDNWTQQGASPSIVRIDSSGSERVLADGVNPAVSPDGEWIVFSMAVGRSRHLFLMRVDGSELAQLSDGRAVDVQPVWSPDGEWIAFTSNRGHADMRHRSRSNWDVWVVRRNGEGLTRLTRDPARDGAPTFSRDGAKVLFHSDRKVGKEDLVLHQLQRSPKGFHIWQLAMPAIASH